jgi:hypothetical protein
MNCRRNMRRSRYSKTDLNTRITSFLISFDFLLEWSFEVSLVAPMQCAILSGYVGVALVSIARKGCACSYAFEIFLRRYDGHINSSDASTLVTCGMDTDIAVLN